jgi:hypothetical protein
MGLAEDLRAAQVKIFCPKCEQAMTPMRMRDGKHMMIEKMCSSSVKRSFSLSIS